MDKMAATDCYTQRPRTPNDPYSRLSETQIKNTKSDRSSFFQSMPNGNGNGIPDHGKLPREGGRYYMDRYAQLMSRKHVRGEGRPTGDLEHCYIGERKDRRPEERHNTARGLASVKWGPQKAGERTRSHFFGEDINRYMTIDCYRRPATNYAGRVVMDHGRPADGYYCMRFPSRTTWTGTSAPLNRQGVLDTVYRKTTAEYEAIAEGEKMVRRARVGQWPEYSHYTEKFLLRNETNRTGTEKQIAAC